MGHPRQLDEINYNDVDHTSLTMVFTLYSIS